MDLFLRAETGSYLSITKNFFNSVYRIVLSSSRPFFLDLGMAVGVFCAWLALSGFEPLIAAATDKLHLAVSLGEYRLQWPLGPAALGIVGLVLSWVRYRFFPGGPQLQDRLHRAALLAVVLLALRLVSLLDPIVYVFPYLTLLWSPHALWAVALVFMGYVHLPSTQGQKAPRTAYIAGTLLVICLPLYFLYTLYFCQVTMLHGDEGQYLRVTQSLLHDGDMDLANNLGAEQIGNSMSPISRHPKPPPHQRAKCTQCIPSASPSPSCLPTGGVWRNGKTRVWPRRCSWRCWPVCASL